MKGINNWSEIAPLRKILLHKPGNEYLNLTPNTLERLLFALGIRQIGAKTAKILARKYKNIDSLMQATVEELTNINDIGSTIASSIVAYFKDKENIEIINKLKNYGVNMTYLDNKNISVYEFITSDLDEIAGISFFITVLCAVFL